VKPRKTNGVKTDVKFTGGSEVQLGFARKEDQEQEQEAEDWCPG